MTAPKDKDRIPDELIDQLLSGYKKPEDLTGESGILKQLTARLIERAMQAEMTEHLGYEKHAPEGRGAPNSRNGTRAKTLRTDHGELEIEVPRDRASSFEPQIVKKRQTSFTGFDEKILALYARGMTVRDIQGHLEELYGVEVSPDLISRATSAVHEDVLAWQNRSLDAVYTIVYLDALVVKVRDQGSVRNKSIYLAIGVTVHGTRDVLGIWIEQSEGAKFWLKVMNELKQRGVHDILIVCCDGLKGFPEAIETVYPQATVQTCIVHMIRNSLRYVSFKDRKAVVKDLKPIYQAVNREEAEAALLAFEAKWGRRYEMITSSWRTNWERVVPFLDFPEEIRRVIYTTNQIEALNSSLRKLLQYRGSFPNDESVTKILFLALRRLEKKWERTLWNWSAVLGQFAIYFQGRIPAL
ncbi:MAG: IS256 family transposase [Planctomycetes bacterium]|nr:IS256 family transposase [Planctomycetota bacterium]